MSKPIIITGRAAVLASKWISFDPGNPTETQAHQFSFLDPDCLKDGALNATWAKDYRLVGFADLRIELLPQDDTIKSAVKGLKAQKKAVIAAAQVESTRIEGEIQKLLAISYDNT